MKGRWVKKVGNYGTTTYYETPKERLLVFLFTCFFRLIMVFLVGLVVLVIFAYLYTCVPAWFQPFMNAPLICIGRH